MATEWYLGDIKNQKLKEEMKQAGFDVRSKKERKMTRRKKQNKEKEEIESKGKIYRLSEKTLAKLGKKVPKIPKFKLKRLIVKLRRRAEGNIYLRPTLEKSYSNKPLLSWD